jgi:hypothetical protein
MSLGESVLNLAIKIGINDGEAAAKFEGLAATVDKTAAKWSSFGTAGRDAAGQLAGGLDSVIGYLTPLNVGLAAAGTAMAAFGVASAAGLSALRSGGEFNEARTGFRSLADAAGVSADAIVKSIARISGGTISMQESMQSATKAIRAGFSEEQIEAVYTFAKRYSEATGKGFTESADAISEAIMTGRTKTLKTYGLMATDIDELFVEIKKKTADFGQGAFNFGDIETAITKQLGNIADVFGAQWNEMLGKSATGDALQGIVDGLMEIALNGAEVAQTIGEPIIAVFDSIVITAQSVWAVFAELSDMTGVTMGGAFKAFLAEGMAVASFIGSEFNVILGAFTGLVEIAAKEWAWFLDIIGETEKAKSLNELAEKIGDVRVSTESLDKAASNLKYGFESQNDSAARLSTKHQELTGSIKDTSKEQERAAKEMERIDAALEKNERSIASLDRASEDYTAKEEIRTAKRAGDIETETKLKEIGLEKQALAYAKQDEKNEEQRVKAVTRLNEAIRAVEQRAFDTSWEKRKELDAKVVEAQRELDTVLKDITNTQQERELKRREDEIKAADEARKRELDEAAAKIEADKRVTDEREKRRDLFNKGEELASKKLVDATKEYAGERAKLLGGGEGGQAAGAASSALVADAEKSRTMAGALAETNKLLASKLDQVLSSGIKFKMQVTGGQSAIEQLVVSVIQRCQDLAKLEGATVAGV